MDNDADSVCSDECGCEALTMAGPEKGIKSLEYASLPSPTLAKLTRQIMDDTIYNIIHDLVAKVHREEKIARQQSAVVIARQLAEKQAADQDENAQNAAADNGATAAPSADMIKKTKAIKVETPGAIFKAGKVYLKGNALETTKEILCPNCHLPRLLYPAYGQGSRPPPDLNKEYCRNQPPIRMAGRDLHGQLFAVEKVTKKKKTQPSAGTPGSSPPSIPDTSGPNPLLLPKTGQVYVPTTKCPNCPRYFLLTKTAQHLDRCLGISTRQSRIRTPLNSEVSTPSASQPTGAPRKRGREGEDESTAPVKKRKEYVPTKLKGQKPTAPSKLKNGTIADTPSCEKTPKLPNGSKAGKHKPS
ncbi:hypothetical protein FQN57_003653 [Myotisia sp. PD_48]|nr:hypothetical protein FQN57_003653 [Myotisia sp. PD_48]